MDPLSFPSGIFISTFDSKRPIDWREQFANDHPLHLEIGFGHGEYLLYESGRNSGENFIGIEQDWARLCKCLTKVTQIRQKTGDSRFAANMRLLRIDATIALQRFFDTRSLDVVTCLFPCPWPKKAHIKYRLFSHEFLCLLNSRLKDKAKVRIVSDWKPYIDWMIEELAGTGFRDNIATIKPQFNTKFERKWKAQGQEEFWELVLSKTEHIDRPVIEDVELRAFFAKDFVPQKFRLENLSGEPSVIYKDFVFDSKNNLGLVRLIVAEKFLTQHVWVSIIKTKSQWCIAKADGHSALPTAGVALAIERVRDAVKQTTE